MDIGAILNRDVVVGFKHMALSEAARLMRERHVGCLVIVEDTDAGRVPIGMLTDRDIVVAAVAKDLDARTIATGDVMATDLVTAREDDDTIGVLRRMRRSGIRRLPVLKRNGTLAGIVTVDDVFAVAVRQLTELSGAIDREQAREIHTRP